MRVLCLLVPANASPAGEVFASLAQIMETVSPVVEAAAPDALYADLTGAALPNEAGLACAVLQAVQHRLGLWLRAGVGRTKLTARIAATIAEPGEPSCLPAEPESAALAPVPIRALPCSPEMQRRLHLFGLDTIGAFLALPFGPVQAQFGAEGARLWRLAAGLAAEQVIAQPRPLTLTERLELWAPTAESAALLHAAEVLLRRLVRRPEAGNRLARRLTVTLDLEDGRAWTRTLPFHTPTVDTRLILLLLRSRLASLTLAAAVVAVTLTLHDLCGERGLQAGLFAAKGHRPEQLDAAIQQLNARLGTTTILRVVEVEPWSRIPEQRFALAEERP